jgi:hypothetical protein
MKKKKSLSGFPLLLFVFREREKVITRRRRRGSLSLPDLFLAQLLRERIGKEGKLF